ncbi:MAG: hypothetical protein ACOYML_13360 [Microthrixaceae bacterium]
MNDLTAFVSTVVGALNDAGFPYLVTGSFASIVYSEPRTTMDIDVVVHAPFERLEEFRQQMLALGLYAPSIDATTDMFNVIDLESGWKADIICWQDEPFEHERFARRSEVELLPGVNALIPTVEDMILAKLRWIQGRDSALQLRDVESMIEVNARSLDRKYLMEWATRLGFADRLEELLGSSGR